MNASNGKIGRVDQRRPRRLARGMGALPRRRRLRLACRRFTSTVQASLEASGFEIRVADHLGQGPLRPLPRPLPLATRAVLVCRARHGALEGRPLAVDALEHPLARGPRARARHAEAGRVHAPADAQQLFPRPSGLRALLRLRDHHHRGRDDRQDSATRSRSSRPMSMWPSSAGRRSRARAAVLEGDNRSFAEVAAERSAEKPVASAAGGDLQVAT